MVVFYIRASYWLPSLSFHDNRASHSRDTIWPRKFKVKGKGQKYPSQRNVHLTQFLSVSHQGILSTPVSFVPWQSGLPFPRYNLTLKIKGQRSRSKVKVKGTLVSIASSWLISFLLHINWTNHSSKSPGYPGWLKNHLSHRNRNIIILMNFSSLAASEVVKKNNFRWSQWWKFYQSDDIPISE